MEKTKQRNDFIAFLNAMENVHADKFNPAYKSRYSSLSEILKSVKEVAKDYNLAVRQLCSYADGVTTVSTMIIHADGGHLDGVSVSAKTESMNPQQLGSALTYLRRHSLQIACGISVDNDDDANVASKVSVPNVAWWQMIPVDVREASLKFIVSKGWLKDGQKFDDVSASVQDTISSQLPKFIKAVREFEANSKK